MSGTVFTEKELEDPGRRQMSGGNFGEEGMCNSRNVGLPEYQWNTGHYGR